MRVTHMSKLTSIQSIARNKALAYGKRLDKQRAGNKWKAAETRMDVTSPCPHCHGSGKVLDSDGKLVKCEFGACPTCDGIGRYKGGLCDPCHGTGQVRTCNGRGRVQLDALGTTKHLNGKSNGVIATPSSYTAWVRAGQPAHPIYNIEAWHAERYVNGIALPTAGPTAIAAPTNVRHMQDCVCRICTEFKAHIQRPEVYQVAANTLSPVEYGPWPRPNGLRPPLAKATRA